MASGMNRIAWLKEMIGDQVGRKDLPTAPLDLIYVHPKGHALRHIRLDDPVDEELRDDIVDKGIEEPLLVRQAQDPKTGDWRLELCDGSRRFNAGHAAQKIMRKAGSKILKDGHLRVELRFFEGTDAEFLIERQKLDKQPLKKHHSTRALCDTVVQFSKHNIEAEAMLDVLPREWTAKIVECVIMTWHTASEELRDRLNREPHVPAGLLPAILKAPAAKRMKVLEDLMTAGVSTVAGATRALHAAERSAEIAAETDVGEGEIDGDESLSDVVEEGDDPIEDMGLGREDDESERKASAPARPAKKIAAPVGPKVRPLVEAVSPKLVKRVALDLESKSSCTHDERAFVLGAQAGLGREYAKESVLPMLDSLPQHAKSVVAGMLWRLGIFGPKVQQHVTASTLALLEGARMKKPVDKPKKAAKKGKGDGKKGKKS